MTEPEQAALEQALLHLLQLMKNAQTERTERHE